MSVSSCLQNPTTASDTSIVLFRGSTLHQSFLLLSSDSERARARSLSLQGGGFPVFIRGTLAPFTLPINCKPQL
ncbi:hypothetical protein AAC387_Pa06g0029 [Persea americana]